MSWGDPVPPPLSQSGGRGNMSIGASDYHQDAFAAKQRGIGVGRSRRKEWARPSPREVRAAQRLFAPWKR
jgi:hypothetical protein